MTKIPLNQILDLKQNADHQHTIIVENLNIPSISSYQHTHPISQIEGLEQRLQSISSGSGGSSGILELLYPVGAIYINSNNTDPSSIFGGTWQQLENTTIGGQSCYCWKRTA